MQPKTQISAPVTLDALYHLIQSDLKEVDETILSRVKRDVPLIHDIARHIIASGGKRIRPAITLISAQLCGYRGKRHIGLAASMELIHTATLLHDDVVDESKLRRGIATANDMYGNKSSILVGDFLLSQAFQLMVLDGSLAALDILSNASSVISQGEVEQLMVEGDLSITQDVYMRIITAKTAVLFAAASELGALASENAVQQAALRDYGLALGIAFQLVDDALDYAADEKTLGKKVGDDFREGKITLPVLLAYSQATNDERAFFARTMSDHQQQPDDLAKAIQILNRYHTIESTIKMAEDYSTRAKNALASFKPSPARDAMFDLADFCIQRAY